MAPAGTYDIRIKGHLGGHWADELGAAELVQADDGTTVLRGIAGDQAVLHGLLQRLRDLGITLIGVTLSPADPTD